MSEERLMTEEELAAKALHHTFVYHAPDAVQLKKYTAVRAQAKEMAFTIFENCPESEDMERAVERLRECVMWANASIALEGIAHV